jgi:predicted DNA repair protein MutK
LPRRHPPPHAPARWPATGLLALVDDVASLLDDIALLTRVAARKTAGVIGDDLALNAEQVTGMRADRELPVIWAVAKGALLNKVILVPAALLVSAFVPRAITPLLMAGGLFLCYEGFEKVWEKLRPETPAHRAERAARVQAVADPRWTSWRSRRRACAAPSAPTSSSRPRSW